MLSTFGVMFAPDHATAASEMAARRAAPAAASASPTGRPTASSARCSRRSAATCRRRPACSRRRCWGVGGAPRALFGDRRRDRRDAAQTSTSAIARPRTSSTSSAPGTGRCTRRSPRCPPRARASWMPSIYEPIAQFNEGGDGTMVVPDEGPGSDRGRSRSSPQFPTSNSQGPWWLVVGSWELTSATGEPRAPRCPRPRRSGGDGRRRRSPAGGRGIGA